jgi:ubiquitin-conjugating enzyme E2 M
MNFDFSFVPDSGFWKGARLVFKFSLKNDYPYSPPHVECATKIYHPNIDLAGKVCLNILRGDWKPVLDLNNVMHGLYFLFYDPNPLDPLNLEAAQLFRNDVAQFERVVKSTLQGRSHGGESFPKLL